MTRPIVHLSTNRGTGTIRGHGVGCAAGAVGGESSIGGDDELDALAASPYFRGLPVEDLAGIRARAQRRDLAVGESILREGEPPTGLLVVRSGRVRVFTTSASRRGAREQVLMVLGPGESFNDASVFDGGPSSASAQAAGPGTSVYLIPARVMRRLLATDPRVAANVARALAAQLRQLVALVGDLSFRHVTPRVAKLLLEEGLGAQGYVPLSQQEMATRVGTVREMVNRALRELERGGAIARRRSRIVRLDAPALRAFLDPATDPAW